MKQFLIGILTFSFLMINGFGITQEDTVYLTLEEFLLIVEENHPIARQAGLKVDYANANKRKAHGAFDPKLFSDMSGKFFNDKEYYFLSNSGMKIPTWFGMEIKGGYEYNDGDYLSASKTVPGSGLWYLGVTVPVGKNLFIDERRTVLRQAGVLQDQSELEKRLMLNDLLLSAKEAYWEWYAAHQKLEVARRGVQLSEERKQAIVQGAIIEEYPIIDTVEAHIQLDTRRISYENQLINYAQVRAQLATFLWLKNEVPLELHERTLPVYDTTSMSPNLRLEADTSGFTQVYSYKLDYLRLEERLKKEMLKPQIDLTFTPLVQPTSPNTFRPYDPEDFKWGVTASFPIFLRKERGEIAMNAIKQKEAGYDRQMKVNELENKFIAYKIELSATGRQLEMQRQMVANYQRLTNAEITKYNMGESSLFLVNSREIKYLEALEKLAEMEQKLEKTKAKLAWLMVNP